MDTDHLKRQFVRIGARVKVRPAVGRRAPTGLAIDIGRDPAGEFFDIAIGRDASQDLSVVDTQPGLRHLLLMTRERDGKHKFLCGHDERHWFVAAVPEKATVSTVKTAFAALMPPTVLNQLNQGSVKPKNRNRRRNQVFLRQGEWFFVPVSRQIPVSEMVILRNEPLRRGAGKPHTCEELVRLGGKTVYVSHRYPNGLTETQYQNMISSDPELRNLHWVIRRRNPEVFVRGRIRHADHQTIELTGWHQVLMNTETQAVAMQHVAFLD